VPSGDDLNKPKKSFKHNYRGGDNPMNMPMHETLKYKLKNLYTKVKGR
jgi:citrate lyase alpha subunit